MVSQMDVLLVVAGVRLLFTHQPQADFIEPDDTSKLSYDWIKTQP